MKKADLGEKFKRGRENIIIAENVHKIPLKIHCGIICNNHKTIYPNIQSI